MELFYLIFYACLRLRFLDVAINPGLRRPVPAFCRILCCNVRCPEGNISDLTLASSQYDIRLCSETLVSDMRHVLELLFSDSVALSCCAEARCLRPDGCLHTYEIGYGAFRQPKFEWCDCGEMLVFRVCGVRPNLYIFSLYRNPDLNDRIFNCLHSINGCRAGWGCPCLFPV